MVVVVKVARRVGRVPVLCSTARVPHSGGVRPPQTRPTSQPGPPARAIPPVSQQLPMSVCDLSVTANMTSKHSGAPLQSHHVYKDCWTMRQRAARNAPRMAPSHALARTNPAVPRMPAWAPVHGSGAWVQCRASHGAADDSTFSQLFTFRSLVNSPSGLIATALLSLRLCHSLPATPSATIV